MHTVELTSNAVVFHSYPFPGARVYPSGSVPWSEVLEVDPGAYPPEIRIAGETLFVDARYKDDLRRTAEAHGVPEVRRVDVWGMLLEPFLDTSFSEADQERTLARLEENGVPREQARQIRIRLEKRMVEYNIDSMRWEWVHLGMWDLFHAHLSGERAVAPDAFLDAYRWAQEIAQRAA